MNYIDQHMHSYFSFDSNAQFIDYLKQTSNKIVTTEHLDLDDPSIGADRPLDLEGYLNTIDALNQQHDNRLLKGLEVGWSQPTHDRLVSILDKYSFDLLLLSVHNNGVYDYMNRRADLERDPQILVPQYLDNLYEAVSAMHERIHVLAHFDYGFRVVDVTVEDLEKYGKNNLIKLFDLMIEKKISFEVNTSSIVSHGNLSLYEFAIELYIERGGTLFTLGSDSHVVETYQRYFNEMASYLKSLGIDELAYYIKGERHMVAINSLL